MKRYINQLTVAKKQCEKRIRMLGGPDYDQQEDGALDEGEGPQSQKVQLCVSVSDHLMFVLGAVGSEMQPFNVLVFN